MSTMQATTTGTRDDEAGLNSLTAEDQSLRKRLMKKYAIGFNGRQYEHHRYCYDRLSDAIAYARLGRANFSRPDPGGPVGPRRVFTAPTDAERDLMASLHIAFEAGMFRFETFRYDDLSDAVSYARLQGAGPKETQ